MAITESVETRSSSSSSMEAEEGEQPSVSRSGEAGEAAHEEEVKSQQLQQHAGSVQEIEGKPLEMESVDSSRAGGEASSNRNDVYTKNLDETAAAGTSSSISSSKDIISDAGPSSPKGGTAGGREMRSGIDDEDANYRLDEGRSSGAEGGGARSEENLLEGGDPPRPQQQQRENDPSTVEGDATQVAGPADNAAEFRAPPGAFIMPTRFPSTTDKSSEHLIDIPFRMGSKAEELDTFKRFGIPRTLSNFSRASLESATGDQCRICQQHADEPLMELGCQCRGELAKAHRSCVDHWFGNKGTNKCEVCQHVATNVPLPSSQPTPHFWVWRVGGPYNATPRRGGVRSYRLNPLPMRPILLMTLRRHPIILLLWLLLFAFMAYLFVDVTDSTSIGYAAMPIGFLFGVLVVLGLGTAARLVLECWHERAIRRNIQRMEEEPNFEDFIPEQTNNTSLPLERVEGQESSNGPSPSPGNAEQQGAAEASVTASVAATAAPDVENR